MKGDKIFVGRVIAILAAIGACLCLIAILDKLQKGEQVPNDMYMLFAGALSTLGISLPSPFHQNGNGKRKTSEIDKLP